MAIDGEPLVSDLHNKLDELFSGPTLTRKHASECEAWNYGRCVDGCETDEQFRKRIKARIDDVEVVAHDTVALYDGIIRLRNELAEARTQRRNAVDAFYKSDRACITEREAHAATKTKLSNLYKRVRKWAREYQESGEAVNSGVDALAAEVARKLVPEAFVDDGVAAIQRGIAEARFEGVEVHGMPESVKGDGGT